MAPSLPKAQPVPMEKGHSSASAAMASAAMVSQALASQSRLLIPTSVHTHMYASVVNAEAAAEAARQALHTAEAVAGKATTAADIARRKAAVAVAAEEQALQDVALCKAAAAIASEHHASTVRNLLQLPQAQMSDGKGQPHYHRVSSGIAASPRSPAAAPAAASMTPSHASARDHSPQDNMDALAVAAATAVARACIQQHMSGNFNTFSPSFSAAMATPEASRAMPHSPAPASPLPPRCPADGTPAGTKVESAAGDGGADKGELCTGADAAGKAPSGSDRIPEDQVFPPHSSDIQAAAAATLLALSEAAATGRTISAHSHSKPQLQPQPSASEPEISDAWAAAAAAIANAYSKRQRTPQPPPPPHRPQPVAPATSSTPGTPGQTPPPGTPRAGDGASQQAAVDIMAALPDRKRQRDGDALPCDAAGAIAAKMTKPASDGHPPPPARTQTPPPAATAAATPSPGIKDVSADETTADGATPEPPGSEVGTEHRTASCGVAVPHGVHGAHEGPQVLGASAQALISREAWLNEAANYPQHTLAHLPPITILPEAPVASSLALLCRTPAESEMAAARSKLERVIAGQADVQDAFPYKMESSIYKAFSRELLWFIKTVARSCGFVDRQRLFSPKKLLLRSMSFWRACLAAAGRDAQHIFFLRDSYLMLIVPGLWVQARVAEGNTPEAPPAGAALPHLRGELLKQSKLFVGFAKNFHRLVPECSRPVFAVFAPSPEGVMPELLR